MNSDFPNEAYADLMALVAKHNLSNATGNAIIKFLRNMRILVHLPSKTDGKLQTKLSSSRFS
jgi:hypothetical protein